VSTANHVSGMSDHALPCISRHPLAKPSLADQPGLLRFAPTVLVKRSRLEAASGIDLNCAHSQRSFMSDKKAEGRENLHGTLFAFAHPIIVWTS
jgi:hypothetical protein